MLSHFLLHFVFKIGDLFSIHPSLRENCKTVWQNQGPVVQGLVSLMSSLRVISLTVLVDSIYNILIFFADKM